MKNILAKLKNALPWLIHYPVMNEKSLFRNGGKKKHIVFTVADHFEPSWSENGFLDIEAQRRRLNDYHKLARKTGEAIKDADGTKFRHTNFFPAEQYDRRLLEQMAAMQAEGLGEVEIHLHHGVEKPDTAENLRKTLIEFRDCLAEEHKCLSRLDGRGAPMYAFVHGNLALANSCGGKYCGVDSEMQILQDTGCYADMTLPSVPGETQVPVFNQIYECALPLAEKAPHRAGVRVRVSGNQPKLPLIFTGPLVLNWTRRIKGVPVPRFDDGGLVANQPMDLARLNRWLSANVTVENRPEWIFVKLYCHGFFDRDQPFCIGDEAAQFFGEVIEAGEKSGDHRVYFASAREAFNMVAAAIDGKTGSPGEFRDYRLKSIMSRPEKNAENKIEKQILAD